MAHAFNALLISHNDNSSIKHVIENMQGGLLEWRFAENEDEAFEFISYNVFDLVIIDCAISDKMQADIYSKIRSHSEGQFTSVSCLAEQSTLEQRLKAYDIGADDFIDGSMAEKELEHKLKVWIHFQQKRKELIEKFESTKQELIQNQFDEESDTSLLMSLYKKCITIQSVDQLVQELKVVLLDMSLSFSLQISTEQDLFHCKDDDTEFSPIEVELFTTLQKNESKVQNFGHKSYFKNGHVELVVHNMPIENKSLYGRLKDLLHLLIGVVNDKMNQLNIMLEVRSKCDDILNAIALENLASATEEVMNIQQLLSPPEDVADDDGLSGDFVFF